MQDSLQLNHQIDSKHLALKLENFFNCPIKINVSSLASYKTRLNPPFSKHENVWPSQEYDSCYPFVWYVCAFNIVIWLGTFRSEFSSEFSFFCEFTFLEYIQCYILIADFQNCQTIFPLIVFCRCHLTQICYYWNSLHPTSHSSYQKINCFHRDMSRLFVILIM